MSDDFALAFESALSDAVIGDDEGAFPFADEDGTTPEAWSETETRGAFVEEIMGDEADAFAAALDAALPAEDVIGVNPAARQVFKRRAVQTTPMRAAKPALEPQLREWQIDFGPVFGPAGAQTTITLQPQCLFRGEKIMATDTGTTAGRGTRIVSVTVGMKVQRPAGVGATLTQFFSSNALGNGITFDTANEWTAIAVTVSFVESCTFDMTVFGKAVVDE